MKKIFLTLIVLLFASFCFAETNTEYFSTTSKYERIILDFYNRGSILIICTELPNELFKYTYLRKESIKKISLVETEDGLEILVGDEGYFNVNKYEVLQSKNGNITILPNFFSDYFSQP